MPFWQKLEPDERQAFLDLLEHMPSEGRTPPPSSPGESELPPE
jgi:hypothetical protein